MGMLTPTIYTRAGLDALSGAVQAAGPGRPLRRPRQSGYRDAPGRRRRRQAIDLALAVADDNRLALEGFWTHLAVADEVDDPYTAGQVARYQAALDALAGAGVRPPLRHAANSAGAMWHPASRYDLVRCGIALYGLAPDATGIGRGPATRLRAGPGLKGPGVARPDPSLGGAVVLRACATGSSATR